jgi:vacuolar-type H+-ATPase subunit H
MDTVVSKLLYTDRQARQALDEAKQYYDRTIEEIGREKERILQDHLERAEKHLAEARQAETAQVDESVAKINSNRDARIRALEENYEENHERWVDEMLARIVARE